MHLMDIQEDYCFAVLAEINRSDMDFVEDSKPREQLLKDIFVFE